MTFNEKRSLILNELKKHYPYPLIKLKRCYLYKADNRIVFIFNVNEYIYLHDSDVLISGIKLVLSKYRIINIDGVCQSGINSLIYIYLPYDLTKLETENTIKYKFTHQFICTICAAKYPSEKLASECFDRHIKRDLFCICCDKKMNEFTDFGNIKSGTIFKIEPWYGSKYDDCLYSTYENCLICDNCIEKIIKKKDKRVKGK